MRSETKSTCLPRSSGRTRKSHNVLTFIINLFFSLSWDLNPDSPPKKILLLPFSSQKMQTFLADHMLWLLGGNKEILPDFI